MSNETNNKSELSPLKRALLVIKELQGQLDEIRTAQTEPIAVIGTGCRFPGGVNNARDYWQLLSAGRDAIREVPPDRWDIDQYYDPDTTVPGKMNCKWGGFLNEVDRFDAQFFGISGREAVSMDPQQRLLLEVAWEALENAGITDAQLKGSITGVFIGAFQIDYTMMQIAADLPVDIYTGLGNANSIIANRLSYLLDLKGPSITLDTACSSSLVAVHLACQSLRNHECDQAFAGGVNLIIDPLSTLITTKVVGQAVDGHCKTFDARADGMVRGEGCGIVILKRLRDALKDGDKVLALIRGSAVNQDGRSANITAPNGLAQVEVIRKALASASVNASAISYIETHGTGTALGDPIEVEALAEVYGQRDAGRCALGAVKTNLGHLEAASGIAGLIKAVLCFEAEAIPANLHFNSLNPNINLSGSGFLIPTALMPWRKGDEPRCAAVSSFGFGGTNAHLILSEPPAVEYKETAPGAGEQVYLLPLSARSEPALRALANNYIEYLRAQADTESLYDITYNTAIRRSHHHCRLSVAGRTGQELIEGLDSYLNDALAKTVSSGSGERRTRPQIVFVFPGQGSQWAGMGMQLMAQDEVFAQTIAAIEPEIAAQAGWSLVAELAASREAGYQESIDKIQPMLFAIEVALASMWRSRGITADLVIGHSMGEVAACYVAGAISLNDAVKIICRRSLLLSSISGGSGMAAVELPFAEAQAAIEEYRAAISIAVCNSPTSTALAGESHALAAMLAKLERAGVHYRTIKVDVASHSPVVEELCPELRGQLAEIKPGRATLPICSTVTAQPINGEDLTADYWVRNLREPVLFAQAIAATAQDNDKIYIEMSPHPILLQSIEESLQHYGYKAEVIASLRRQCDEALSMQVALGELYCAGYQVDWHRRFTTKARHISLPTYAWQRERYWVEASRPASAVRTEPREAFHNWFYQLKWRHKARKGSSITDLSNSRWLILPDGNGLARSLAALIEERQGQVVLISPATFNQLTTVDDYRRLLAANEPHYVVNLSAMAIEISPDGSVDKIIAAQQSICGRALALIQAAQAMSAGLIPQIWYVTSRAQAVAGAASGPALAQSLLWGLGRVAYLEASEIWGGLIDLDTNSSSTANVTEI